MWIVYRLTKISIYLMFKSGSKILIYYISLLILSQAFTTKQSSLLISISLPLFQGRHRVGLHQLGNIGFNLIETKTLIVTMKIEEFDPFHLWQLFLLFINSQLCHMVKPSNNYKIWEFTTRYSCFILTIILLLFSSQQSHSHLCLTIYLSCG